MKNKPESSVSKPRLSIRAATLIARKIERGEIGTLSQVVAACRAARR